MISLPNEYIKIGERFLYKSYDIAWQNYINKEGCNLRIHKLF